MKQLFLFSLVILFFASCRKDNGNAAPNLLLGKWEYGLYKIHNYDPSYLPERRDTTMIFPNENGNYIDFRDDNFAYTTYTDGTRGRSPYKIIDNKLLILNGDTLQITSITANKFTTYKKEVVGYAYSEEWGTYLR